MIGLCCAGAVASARSAYALIGGVSDPSAFHDANSPYYAMDWSYIYPIHAGATASTRSGSAVAIGYFQLLTADHVQVSLGDTIRVRNSIFEVVGLEQLASDTDGIAPPDLKVLEVQNRLNPHEPLPGYYGLYTGPLDANHKGLVLVGWGLGGAPGGGSANPLDGSPPSPSGRQKRWGTNEWSGNLRSNVSHVYSTTAFAMSFWPGATDRECYLGDGDSGGGAFLRDGDGEWMLAGINLYSPSLNNQPWVISASMPAYADQLAVMLQTDLLPGDSDLDGDVDVLDYLTVKASMGSRNRTWRQGDFDNDGDVDRSDLLAVMTNLGHVSHPHPIAVTPTPPWQAGDSTIPEPGALALLGAGSVVLLRRRRRPR